MRATRSKTKLANPVQEVPQEPKSKTTKRLRKAPPEAVSANLNVQPVEEKRAASGSQSQEPEEMDTSVTSKPNDSGKTPMDDEIILLSDSEMPTVSAALPSDSSGRKTLSRKRAKPQNTLKQAPPPVLVDIVSSDSNSNSNSSNVEPLLLPVVPEKRVYQVSSSDASDAGDGSSEEDLPVVSKRRNRSISSSSESDSGHSDEGSKKTSAKTNNFANLFMKTQGKLHGPKILTTEAVIARNVHDPVARKLLTKTSGRFPSASSKKRAPTTAKTYDTDKYSASASTKPSKSETAIEKPVTAGQLAIADMDTDTEVEMEDDSARKVSNSHLNGTREDENDRLNDSLERFMATLKPAKKLHNNSQKKSTESVPKTKAKASAPVTTVSSPKVAKLTEGLRYQQGYVAITVRFRDKKIKFDANEDWDLETVRKTVAEKVNIPAIDVLLYYTEGVSMSDGKKLKDFGIDGFAMLDALVRTNVPGTSASPAQKPDAANSISIKFQKSGLRKPVYLKVSKFAEFSDIRNQLAQKLSIDDASILNFKFDGENVGLSQCPGDLDMDDEDCVDVFEK